MTHSHNDPAAHRQMYDQYPNPEKRAVGPENRFDTFVFFVSIFAGISIFLGVNSVLPGEGVTRNALVIFLSLMGGALSYQANKAVFHLGSKLAAARDGISTALVIGWFALMATVVGTIGFAGVAHEIVEAARLRAPLQSIAEASQMVGESTAQARRILPLISGGASDIHGIAACEGSGGCVSGRRGSGPEVSALNALAGKFRDVISLYDRADRRRSELAGNLEQLAAKYEEQLNQGGVTAGNRAKLLRIYSQAQTLATEVANVVPTAAAQGLISELRSLQVSTPKPGKIDVGARLRGHADRLEEALAGVATARVALPPFPAPSGIAVGWERLDLTWPLAVLIFGLEAILVFLWALMVRDFTAHRRAIERVENDTSSDTSHRETKSLGRRATPSMSADNKLIGRTNGEAS